MNTRFELPDPAAARQSITVSQLNRAVASMLERGFPLLWVGGEISNFTRAGSGHWYFTLKDATASVRAVMFRSRAQYVDFRPREGDRVEVRATVSLYEPRGDFQLNVEQMRQAGAGDLYAQFLRLKERLAAEGLFDEDRKRPLPPMPRAIGVITSPRAAALRDVMTTLARRAPQIPVVLYPAAVQGPAAAAELIRMLDAANTRAECDVLVLVRGGGSIEDLWSFNDEALARAVAASRLPVVCGVGHETDFTICDFAADARAATPTAAAVAAAPDRLALLAELARRGQRLVHGFSRVQQRREQRLDLATRLLKPPSAAWAERAGRLERLARRVNAAAAIAAHRRESRLQALALRVRAPRIEPCADRVAALQRALAAATRRRIDVAAERIERAGAGLELVSPQRVLERGYAIVSDAQGQVVRDVASIAAGDALRLRLAHGAAAARVESVDPEGAD